MKRHRSLVIAGLILFLAGWLAWSVLLTESEVQEPEVPVAQPS